MGKVIRGGQAGLTWGRVVRSPGPRPSEAAAGRLREVFHTRIQERRRALDAEFAVVEALLRMGELDAASHALEDQRLALRALSTDLKAVIADATAEQVRNVWRSLPVTAGASRSQGNLSGSRGPTGRPGSRPRLALALVAAMLGLVLVPGLREQPLRMFSARESRQTHEERAAWSEIHAARARLATLAPAQADAEEVTSETRAVHDRILSLPDTALASKALRSEIRGLLAEQSGALQDLQGNHQDAKSLLAEVRALSASLGLGLPEPPVQPPVQPPVLKHELVPPPVLEQTPTQQPLPAKLAPERPVPDLPLHEQPAASARDAKDRVVPVRPDPGSLDVRRAGHAPRAPSAPTTGLQP